MRHPHDPRNCVVGAMLPLVGYPKAYWSWVRGQIYSKLEKIPYDDGQIKAHSYPGVHKQEPPYCLERLGLSPWGKAQPKNNTCRPQRGVRERFPVLMCQMIAQCTQPSWSPQPAWLKVPMLENPAFHSCGQKHWPKGFRTSPMWVIFLSLDFCDNHRLSRTNTLFEDKGALMDTYGDLDHVVLRMPNIKI